LKLLKNRFELSALKNPYHRTRIILD